MDHFLMVNVYETLYEVIEIILEFSFGDSFTFFNHFVECMVATELQDDVYILAILEDVIEKQNIFVL